EAWRRCRADRARRRRGRRPTRLRRPVEPGGSSCEAGGARSPHCKGRRVPLLCGIEHPRDGRSAFSFGRDRQSGLGCRSRLARQRAGGYRRRRAGRRRRVNAAQWADAKQLFLELRVRSAEEWDRLLLEQCSDPGVRSEVRSLLLAEARENPLDRIVGQLGPSIMRVVAALEAPPRQVDRYEVLGEIGRGGMGVVYHARDPRLERTIAVKVLSPSFALQPGAPARLLAEARAASALDHPNICTILEAGQASDGSLFITMPLYSGETLQRVLARGPLPIHQALDIAMQVAEGLRCAHTAGIVH